MPLPILPALLAMVLPATVSGDFDHDGRPDSAAIEKRADGSFAVVITHAGGARSELTRLGADGRGVFLKLAAPGEIAVACDAPEAPVTACPKDQLPDSDALAFGTDQGPEAVALWTGKQFALVWIED